MLKFQAPTHAMVDVKEITKLSAIWRPFFRTLVVSWCLSTTASKSSSPYASHSAVILKVLLCSRSSMTIENLLDITLLQISESSGYLVAATWSANA
jgi:hypothetical protein